MTARRCLTIGSESEKGSYIMALIYHDHAIRLFG